MWSEATIIRRRINNKYASDMAVLHQVLGAAFHGGKEPHKAMNKTLEKLRNAD